MKKFYKKICFVFIIPLMISYYTGANAADYVIPSGRMVGIKIYTEGLVVAGTAVFTDENGRDACPARDAGIKAGDVIKSVNGYEISSCEDFAALKTPDTIECELMRGDELMTARITPRRSKNGEYLIGLWARDSAAGIGTLTFIDPEDMRYAALGHAVTDVDSGSIMTVREGNIQSCGIASVNKGHIGFPGSVKADFGSEILGTIEQNAENEISGAFNAAAPETAEIPVALAGEVHSGGAVILSDIEGGGVREYSAEIDVISRSGVRNMIVEITDEHLLEVTGGIIQGMSGAPIIQDGMLAGAVTHVFVNDPHKGYAIFAENLAG